MGQTSNRLRAALVLSAGISFPGWATAQEQGDIELPEVVVTAPSPVAKPKPAVKPKPQPAVAAKPKTKAKPAPAPSSSEPEPQAPDPAAAQETPAALPLAPDALPGTLLVADDAFVPVTIATARELQANAGATVTDTIAQKPGIVGTSFAPGANRPIIRGLDSYRVRMQENGIGAHDVSAISEDHAVPIDPFSADKVEVVRGPATLRYGSGAIGGVVAVENERIPTRIPEAGVSTEIRGGLSSVDEGRDGAVKATAGANGWAVHGDGFKRQADDYETPRGRQHNTFVESQGGAAGLSRIWDDGFLGIAIARTESLYGVPGVEADEGVDPRIDLVQDKVQARGEWRPKSLGIEAIRFWFGASDYEHVELAKHAHHDEEEHDGEDEHADEEPEGFEVGSRFTNKEVEGRAEIQHVPVMTALGEMSGAAGVQIVHRDTRGQSFEGDSLLEPVETRSVAAFWFEELQATSRLRLQAAARVEETRIDGLGWSDVTNPAAPLIFDGERTFLPVSGSLAALYDVGLDTVFRLSGQIVERAPDAAELFSKGIHEATGTFEIGNPGLGKERAFSLDVGLARAKGPFRFDMAAFYTRYQGYIYRELSGLECEGTLVSCGATAAEEVFDQVLFQQRDATFHGLELAGQYDVAPIWSGIWGIEGQYDFVRARFEGGENVPRIPPHRVGGGLYYRDANWFARLGVLHAFDQTAIGFGEIETPGYTLFSAEVSYTTRLSSGPGAATEMTIGVKGENLADDEVLNHASFKRREEVLEPGASVRLFGTLKLN